MLKPCPFCGEQIQSAAVKCRFCGEWLDPSRRPDASAAPVAAADAGPTSSEPPPIAARPDASASSPSEPSGDTLRGLPRPVGIDPLHESGIHPPRTLLPEPAHAEPARPLLSSPPPYTPTPEPTPLPAVASLPSLQHLSSGTGLLGAGPLPPPPSPASHLSSGPAAPPAPRSAAAALADFERSFLDTAGSDDDPGAGDDDPFTSQVARQAPPPPWGLIAAVVGGVALVAVILFKNELFPPDMPPDTVAADTKAEPTVPLEPPKETKLPPPIETPPADSKALPIQPPPAAPVGPLDQAFTDQLARARSAYSDGKLKAAATTLAELAKTAPDHPQVLLLTAQVQLEESNFAGSQKTADRCVFVDPKLADCWLTLGVLRQNSRDNPGAVTAYENYLKLAPTGHYAHDASTQLARLRPKGAATPTPAPTPAAVPTPAPSKAP